MLLYSGDMIASRVTQRIIGVRFRPRLSEGATVNGSYDLTVDVSTAGIAPNLASMTFDSNHGSDRTRVFDGTVNHSATPLTTNLPFVLEIEFDQPFEWQPARGPIVLDFDVAAATPVAAVWDFQRGTLTESIMLTGASGAGLATTSRRGGLTAQLVLDTDAAPASKLNSGGNAFTQIPFGSEPFQGYRVMDFYEASAIGIAERSRITALAWRPRTGTDYSGGEFDCRITLSTTTTPLASLSTTFNSNHGIDQLRVFDGVVKVPEYPSGSTGLPPFLAVCQLDHPFEYGPELGSLVVDVQVRSHTLTVTERIDAVATASTPDVARLFSFNAWNNPVGEFDGKVAILGVASEPIPTLPADRDVVRGNQQLVPPFNRPAARSMFLYPPTQIPSGKPIWVEHLSFRVNSPTASLGPVTWTCTIDMSEAAVASGPLDSTFDNNHGARRQRVFDGKFSAAYAESYPDDAEFPVSVALDHPFYYDPATGPLLVDIRVTDRNGTSRNFDSQLNSGMWRVADDDPNAVVGSKNSEHALCIRLGGVGGNALAEEYGTGCPGSNGTPRCFTDSLPRLPNPDLHLLLRNGPAGAPAFVVLGLTESNQPLDAFGMPGCTGLNNREFGNLLTFTDASGDGTLPLALPDIPELVGLTILQQWACLDPAANLTGISFSNGQRLVTTL